MPAKEMKRLKTAVPRRTWGFVPSPRFHRLAIMLATQETLANFLSCNRMENISGKSKVDTHAGEGRMKTKTAG
jgi:hypothetical protein